MRFLVRVKMPTEVLNKLIHDPDFTGSMEEQLRRVKAEAAYFTLYEGDRTIYLVVDLPSADTMVTTFEPLFSKFNAKIEAFPVMTLEDLKKGVSVIQKPK